MNLILEYIVMVFNPFSLSYTSMSFGFVIYYLIIAVIFIYYKMTFKYKSYVANAIPIIIASVGMGIIFVFDAKFGFLNGREMGVYDSDEWRMYLHVCMFILVYSSYALIIFNAINKLKNIIKKRKQQG